MQSQVLPALGLWCSMNVLAMLYGWMAVVAGVTWGGAWRAMDSGFRGVGRLPLRARASWVLGVGLVVVAVGAIPRMSRLPQVGASPGEKRVRVAVGREGVVATVTGGTNDWRMLMNNTYTLGGSRAWVNQERQALLPILLHGEAKRVALLGFATGSTTAGALMGPGVEQVDAFELSPLVARMAQEYFSPWNRGVMASPRVRVEVEDARMGMARARGEYDVVMGDLFLPWRTGEGRMYSREHFRSVRRALKPEGLFCQWLPLFQLTERQFEVIARTFALEFPNGFLIRGDFYAELPIVGMVGTADGRGLEGWDWVEVSRQCGEVRRAGGVTDPLLRHAEGVAMTVLGPIPGYGAGPVNTLAGGWVEWEAGRNIVGLQSPWFIGVPWAEFAREVHRNGVGLLPGALRSAHDAGQFFLTLEVAAVAESRVLENLRAQVPDRLPLVLRRDAEAVWEYWPCRVKVGEASPR
jgi:SAM-dependent methyltransferase